MKGQDFSVKKTFQLGEFNSWFCEIFLFPKPNTHTYFLRQKSYTLSACISFISPAVLPVLMWSEQCILYPFVTLTFSKPWNFFLISVIKLLKGSRVQNWCYLTVLWFTTPFRCCTRPAVLEHNAQSHHSSLELEANCPSHFPLPSLCHLKYSLVSAQQPFWLKERWIHH